MRNRGAGKALGALLLFVAAIPGAAGGTAVLPPFPGPSPGDLQEQPGAPSDSEPVPGSSLRVFLLTLGRGDAVWEQFGHNALWIQDEDTGWGAAYNWGLFDFDQVDFVPRLIRGTMLYWMAPADPYATLEDAQRRDRRVWIQELALTPEQKLELLEFAQWNARPENRDYRYDYYRDNCSTRVRDALDRVLGGRIREVTEADTTPRTYRWHTRRLLEGVPWAYLGIQVVLGPRADRPLTAWEETFLPLRLMEEIRSVEVPSPEGGLRPLVLQERALRDSDRPPEPGRPPFALPWFLAVGLLWGGGLVGAVRKGSRGSLIGRGWAVFLGGGWAVLATLGGLLLLGAWAFTDHVFWHSNYNLFQFNPFFLPLLPAFLLFLARGRMPRWGRALAGVLVAISVLGALLELIPGWGQGNLEVLAFTLPVNLGLWAASRTAAEPVPLSLGSNLAGGEDPIEGSASAGLR